MIAIPKIMNLEPNNHSMIEILDEPSKFFSFYNRPVKNIIPSKEIAILEVYQLIKSNRYQRQTEALRAMTDKKAAQAYKAEQFDYITPSGTFTKRNANSLILHSNLMVLDFDDLDDVMGLKEALIADEYFEPDLLFVSPSSNGLKLVTTIDLEVGSHLDWFMAIAEYTRTTYHLEIDPSGKDVCRCCFLPFDEDVFINPIYLTSSFTQSFNSNSHENN